MNWNNILSSDCTVCKLGPRMVYPIFRCGFTSIRATADKTYVNEEIKTNTNRSKDIYSKILWNLDLLFSRKKRLISFIKKSLVEINLPKGFFVLRSEINKKQKAKINTGNLLKPITIKIKDNNLNIGMVYSNHKKQYEKNQ